MDLFAPGHLIPLLIVVAILFFGWKQLPDMARSVGRSLRIFKTEMKGMGEDDAARETRTDVPADVATASAVSPPPAIPASPAVTAPATAPVPPATSAPTPSVENHRPPAE